jgi:hypothetical protein
VTGIDFSGGKIYNAFVQTVEIQARFQTIRKIGGGMRTLSSILLALVTVAGAGLGQTIDLGQSVFLSREEDIIVAIDAALAARKIDSPYVMFMAFFLARGNDSLSIRRDDVTMIYRGQEYKMPTLEEWRKEYRAAQNDVTLYNSLGKDSLILSELRNYYFNWEYDFFALPGRGARQTDEGSLAGTIGFRTKLYFKNPGFKKGDELVIVVKDRKNPEIKGTCGVVVR